MKNLIFTCLACVVLQFANAQQDPMYTQFFSNKIVVNPAYAGTRESFSAVGLHRHQWAGIEGAPRTTTVSLHGPIEKWNTGLGLSLVHDQLGIQRNYSIKLAYAYRIKTKIGTISLGIDGQYKKQDMLWMDSNPLTSDDSYIPYGNNTAWIPNFGAGIYIYKKNYYVGLSVPKLIQNEVDYSNASSVITNNYQRHYFGMAGVHLPLSSEFALKPAVLAKYEVNSPLEMDFNLMAIFSEKFWIGMTYRTNDSFDAIMQIHLENGLRIGYSYDFTTTQLNRVNTGSHEIMIGYDFNKAKKGFYHPRYF
mgnify:CR=1 FL=1